MAVTFTAVNTAPGHLRNLGRFWHQPSLASDVLEPHSYSDGMPDPSQTAEGTDATFATWLRHARMSAGWSKKSALEAVAEVDIPARTYIHWESGSVAKADPKQVRKACLRLGLDVREAAVALGIVTREDLQIGPPMPAPPTVIRNILAALRDIELTEASKVALLEGVQAAYTLWTRGFQVTPPIKEPSAAERGQGKPVKR